MLRLHVGIHDPHSVDRGQTDHFHLQEKARDLFALPLHDMAGTDRVLGELFRLLYYSISTHLSIGMGSISLALPAR